MSEDAQRAGLDEVILSQGEAGRRTALLAALPTDDPSATIVGIRPEPNSVAHSGCGRTGGMFTVHVVALGEAEVGLAVTELRGDDFPEVREAGTDTESGLGLRVVRALTSLFWVSDAGEIRTLLATIPASSGTGGAVIARAGRPRAPYSDEQAALDASQTARPDAGQGRIFAGSAGCGSQADGGTRRRGS